MTQHAKVSTRGRLVIPAMLRNRLGIKSGTLVAMTLQDGALIVEPVSSIIRKLRGSLKDGPAALEYLLAERRGSQTALQSRNGKSDIRSRLFLGS
jgi:AbrB family looped-hinge helix DNA binding protein